MISIPLLKYRSWISEVNLEERSAPWAPCPQNEGEAARTGGEHSRQGAKVLTGEDLGFSCCHTGVWALGKMAGDTHGTDGTDSASGLG